MRVMTTPSAKLHIGEEALVALDQAAFDKRCGKQHTGH